MLDPASLVLVALIIDVMIGDPQALYRRVAHPVALIGRVIGFGERILSASTAVPIRAVASGTALVIIVVALAGAAGVLIHNALAALPGGGYLEALLASTLIAFRSLYNHVRAVALALDEGLETARAAVAHIVGRDPASLDESAVARAAIESAAENFSDGAVAPVFWGLLLGLPGLLVYKAINTLDSMIGHRSARYVYFGRAAARLDDLANWVPARIAGALFCVAAYFAPGTDAARAWSVMFRDARKHRSPNAGWQEAAVAGALGIALAGPRDYAGERVDDAWLGGSGDCERHVVTAVDVHRALRLYLIAGAALTVLLAMTCALR